MESERRDAPPPAVVQPASDGEESRLDRWERRTEWPLIGLSVLFLGLYAWSVLDTRLTPDRQQTLSASMWAIWAVFAGDYLVRLALARRRWRFFRRNLLDLIVIVLPALRQLRVLRLVTVLVLLNRRVQARVRGQVVLYVSGAIVLLGVSAALAVLEAERDSPDSPINTLSDALWWTMTTITTVGYGDYYPTTGQGKLIATGLMIAGIAMLGVVTGSIASWFVEKFGGLERSLTQSADAETAQLRAEIAALRQEISSLHHTITETKTRTPTPANPAQRSGEGHL
ncbi:potassium channel family protein [Saccharopolyspora indica]|uniref:potassium channel family protein n=1 Tax=Saccharopolyspora indica TaxID=1229659 RepID=UPI0022EB165F|nr:potassium channel family protein [Saccharopolyspora indica]MDA3648133.1 potassium channel family protein [Saccharopolyspora indica]